MRKLRPREIKQLSRCHPLSKIQLWQSTLKCTPLSTITYPIMKTHVVMQKYGDSQVSPLSVLIQGFWGGAWESGVLINTSCDSLDYTTILSHFKTPNPESAWQTQISVSVPFSVSYRWAQVVPLKREVSYTRQQFRVLEQRVVALCSTRGSGRPEMNWDGAFSRGFSHGHWESLTFYSNISTFQNIR